jgi:hypothetical protein
MKRLSSILLICVNVAILDFLIAFGVDSTLPFWRETYPSNDHRIRSEAYHHDIAPMRQIVEVWGPIRYRYATNSLGFKDASPRQIDLERQDNLWLLLGDSFTEGIGFDFPTSMAGQIAGHVACRGIEVLNAGVGSYAPSVYWRKARHLIETVGLRPKQVIVFLDISDIRDEIENYHEDDLGNLVVPMPKQPSTMERVGHFLRDHSLSARLFTMVRDQIGYVRKSLKRRFQAAKALGKKPWQLDDADLMEFAVVPHKASKWTYDGADWAAFGEKGRAKATVNMDQLAELLRRHQIPLTLAVYPWPDQIFRDPQAPRHQGYWRDWAARQGAGFVTLFPAFTTASPRETLLTYYIPGDFHWNEAGQRHAAQAFMAGFRPEMPPCGEPAR